MLDGEYREAEYTTTTTINGSKIGAGDQISYSGEYDSCDITPKIGFELGLDVAKPFGGLVETKVALLEEFAPTFRSYTDVLEEATGAKIPAKVTKISHTSACTRMLRTEKQAVTPVSNHLAVQHNILP